MVCAHMKKNVQKISIAMCIQPLILAPAKSPHPLSQGNDAIQNNNFFGQQQQQQFRATTIATKPIRVCCFIFASTR